MATVCESPAPTRETRIRDPKGTLVSESTYVRSLVNSVIQCESAAITDGGGAGCGGFCGGGGRLWRRLW